MVIPSVKEVMNADQFLNPAKEDAIDTIEDLDNIVTCLFITGHVIRAPDTLTDLTVADLVNISHSIRIHIINFIWLKSVRASTASIIEQLFVILYVAI